MTNSVKWFAVMLGLVACAGGDGSATTALADEATPLAVERIELADNGAPGEVDSPDGDAATGAAECQPIFAGCNPRTCDGFGPECDVGEFFSECLALLNYHCGPR